jgi:hypothetical protein
MVKENSLNYNWYGVNTVDKISYVCGYCDVSVAPTLGYFTQDFTTKGPNPTKVAGRVYICSFCTCPTVVLSHFGQVPKPKYGNLVRNITDTGVSVLYNEARNCMAARAYTASNLICRKILMNLAVQHGAKEGDSFVNYITFLVDKGWVPPNGRKWVDQIRLAGNEATHEIKLVLEEEAQRILQFVYMLLKFMYEMADEHT